MRNQDLAAIMALIIVTAIAVGGLALYFKTDGGQINTPNLPSLSSSPAVQSPRFYVADIQAWNYGSLNPITHSSFSLSMTVTDGPQQNLNGVSGFVNGISVGSCTLNLLPNHYHPCDMNGNVTCAQLKGGLPYSLRLVATFGNGQTAEYDSEISPSGIIC